MDTIRVAPAAASLIESMRDIGYSLDTALADIIDNSITANAASIQVMFEPDPAALALAVIDDGDGMTHDQLVDAMRPGSRSPREERAAADLGRFGLGLKTASFSQCRRLTVITSQEGRRFGARWDLDLVHQANDWLLETISHEGMTSLPWLDRLGPSGTLVLWEKLDRLSDQAGADAARDHASRKVDAARSHLELVFHRFLEGDRPLPKVRIAVNDRPLVAFDPFNSRNSATQRLPRETIKLSEGVVTIDPFILPHHKKVSASDWERFGGETGYLRNQGFYLYRAGRLIIHGTWFRLARQSELTKLARVLIDMPNGMDAWWKIDVRKASAQPPYVVRERLRQIIEKITGASHRVYTARGHRLTTAAGSPFWNRRADKGQISYELNREHSVLQGFMDELGEDLQGDFISVLQAVERSFPVDAIFSDVAGDPAAVSAPEFAEADLRQLVALAARPFISKGEPGDAMKRAFANCEPWKSHWKSVERMIDELFAEAAHL